MLRTLGYRAAAAVVPAIPERIGYRLFAVLGDVGYVCAAGHRRLVADNLHRVLGPATSPRELRRSTRLAFRNLLWGYFELFRNPVRSAEDLRAAGTVEGMEHLDTLTGSGAGSVIAFVHQGNLEVLAQLPLLYPAHRFVVVIERMADPRIHAMIRDLRASRGLPTIPTGEARRLVELLRSGTHVILAGDYDSTDSGIVTHFFDRPARLPQGAVKLALRTPTQLVPVHGWRESMTHPRRFRMQVGPPLDLADLGTSPGDVRSGVNRLVVVLEKSIAARPEQWLAFRKVWVDQ